ncbi:hypothetical protein [Nocardia cyriacigeorgica]|uniref:hypothetical protein n=1 Tax=Nocardia cyriacigeorgica TaxID=135487 RepID=UPI0013D43A20|nr:hypothetical protein [Nocardia cyriacigeorgica]MBF6436647.1 hypothetical protein [Nocardia cyriacigeorgica]MBF6452216.1 hypothetical protein [Nocardia cyriacigeorgica]MBF6477733.1 hypothetical protein [Nocardia cyriacigeorgica]MBF6549385.1 hypothetical protein [Nocardia cyriacigeorgica]NEW25221.1 hypothetical protein [Nocardia cyriacigeorgica]
MRRRRTPRRPPARGRWELKAPEHRRPTVHPNPAGMNEKPCGGVMCVPPQAQDKRAPRWL